MSDDQKQRMATSVRARLANLAKQRHEAFDTVLTRYAMERFLLRLSLSLYQSQFVLKGAMVFHVWQQAPHRGTRDLDLLALASPALDDIDSQIREICAIEVEEDGLIFDLTNLSVTDIREDDRYGGARASFLARIGSARIPIQIDFGFGDAVTPTARERDYPTLLGTASPKVLVYPMETVVAEKLEAIVDLQLQNSRMKDFFDLWFIATTFEHDERTLGLAVKRTFERRQQVIPFEIPVGLSDDFGRDPTKEKQWAAFHRRVFGAPPVLSEVIATIRAFALPIFRTAREDQN